MKNRRAPLFAAVGLIILIFAGLAGIRVFGTYIPTNQLVDKQELLQVQGEETAIFFNDELQEAKGISRDGQTYLPLLWINEHLNERFYWDDVEKLLVYTLPDAIVYADKRTMGNGGSPLLLVEQEGIYLSLGLINNYTDIQSKAYNTEEFKRVFIDNRWGKVSVATAGKAGKVRVKGGIKSRIITEVPKGSALRVLEQLATWSKVETEDGYIGYLPSKLLANLQITEYQSRFVPPVYTNISMEEKICLVWHQVTNDAANDAMESLIANTRGVNVIAPTWFALTNNQGAYHSYASRDYVEKAHGMGLKVWGVLDNFNMGDAVDSGILFSRTSVRKNLIQNLMSEVLAVGIDGINLDIEGIKPSVGPHYVQFIRELSIECRKNGIVLSVDNYVPSDYTSFYNRAEQGRVADYVVIMGYDEHYAGGEAGSVASLPYVKRGIEETVSVVPKEKVINAIPLYTRVWTEKDGKTTSSALGMSAAQTWVAEKKVELYWQEELGQSYGELHTEDGIKTVWMEDERSIGLKMDAIRDADLAGVGCWKLGFEPAAIWDIIKVNE
ncbi:MAG: glycosyl hydrolase family 18 protein [Hungatella sp.]